MPDGLPCFLLVVFAAMAMAIAWFNRARTRDLQQSFHSVARWFHGRVQQANWFGMPTVRIPYNHATIEVSIAPGLRGRHCTQATIDCDEFVTPVHVHSATGRRASRGPLRAVDPDWDRQFLVEVADDDEAVKLLTGGVRSAVTMLSRIRKSGGVDIRFGNGQLVVQKQQVLDQPAELTAFVRHVMEIFDQALLARSTGIEFVEHLQAQVIDDAKCPICGDQIEDDLVFCSRCKTPHHRECWHYIGKCATYACGEPNYAEPRVAKPR